MGWLALAALFRQLEQWTGGFDWRNGQIGLAAAACFAVALLASLQAPSPRAGSWAEVGGRWGGKLSYGMYLLHIAWLAPAQMLARDWGVAAGSAVAMAGLLLSCWALHVGVEEPARTLGRARAARMRPPRSATQDA